VSGYNLFGVRVVFVMILVLAGGGHAAAQGFDVTFSASKAGSTRLT
jgi:hypothetical protein